MSNFERNSPAFYRILLISFILVSLSGVSDTKAGNMPFANEMIWKTLAVWRASLGQAQGPLHTTRIDAPRRLPWRSVLPSLLASLRTPCLLWHARGKGHSPGEGSHWLRRPRAQDVSRPQGRRAVRQRSACAAPLGAARMSLRAQTSRGSPGRTPDRDDQLWQSRRAS